MFGNFKQRHPRLEFALIVLVMAVGGGFGLAVLRHAIEIATK
jgi:predicted tellurium resistance membrane protein TerC